MRTNFSPKAQGLQLASLGLLLTAADEANVRAYHILRPAIRHVREHGITLHRDAYAYAVEELMKGARRTPH